MIEMTRAAREQMDAYLHRMRSILGSSRSIAADDVEQSVREHIEIALAQSPAPVDAAEVIGVLDRLGSPEQWLADVELNGLARIQDEPSAGNTGIAAGFLNASTGWQLAWIVFAIFLASLALFQLIGPLLILPAMLASRAYVEFMRQREETLGARRWLVYPALVLVLLFVAALVVVAIPDRMLAGELAVTLVERVLGVSYETSSGSAAFAFGSVVFGLWWIIAASAGALLIRPLRYLFLPLLSGLERRHLAGFGGMGAALAAVGAVLILSP